MRSQKTIRKEILKLDELRKKGQTLEYSNFLLGAYIGLLWAAGLNGNWEKSSKFPSPSNELCSKRLDND